MKVKNAIRGAVLVGATAMTLAVPAQAMAAQSQGGVVEPLDWNGNCSTTTYSGSAWGWCDGTGPQRYRIFVNCGQLRRFEAVHDARRHAGR